MRFCITHSYIHYFEETIKENEGMKNKKSDFAQPIDSFNFLLNILAVCLFKLN